jgi:hypothetical protein
MGGEIGVEEGRGVEIWIEDRGKIERGVQMPTLTQPARSSLQALAEARIPTISTHHDLTHPYLDLYLCPYPSL